MLHFFLIVLFCVLGVITGILTGLLPGLHVNNIALILLSLSSVIVGAFGFLFEYGISENFILILICIYIIATSISHTFHDTIPTTFLGAPEEDTALSVLPAHSLLLEGKGYEAVVLSALGSYGAILFCFLLIYPIRFIIGEPLLFYSTLREIMLFVLIAISILMICTEKGKISFFKVKGKIPSVIGMLFATFVFILSGVFGLVILDFPLDSPIGLSSPVLFPALAGLFGTPTLLTSLVTKPVIPKTSAKTFLICNPCLSSSFKNFALSRNIFGSLKENIRFDLFIRAFRKSKSSTISTRLFVEHFPIICDLFRERFMKTKQERLATSPHSRPICLRAIRSC